MKEIILPNNKVAYEYEDIAFCNMSSIQESARHFMKYGVYTTAPYGSIDYEEFWDREEDKIKNGVILPGKLITNARGEVEIQKVHITGEHYAYLNYGQIKLSKDLNEVGEKVVKDVKHTGVVRKKVSFPSFWDGDYHFFKAVELAEEIGKNLVVFKARRKGYSYKNAFKCALKALMVPHSTSAIGAYDKKYLTKGDATLVMTENYLSFMFDNTVWKRGFLAQRVSSDMYLELGYTLKGDRTKRGYRSKILGLTFMDNPSAARGKDADLILMEEAGTFPNLKESFLATQSILEDGDLVTGIMIVFGTGGSEDAEWEVLEDMFYNPRFYNMVPFHNVWDDGAIGTACGFFHSQALNLVPHIDENGNSLKEKAMEITLKNRAIKKEESQTVLEYNQYVGQRCLKPAEGFSRVKDNLFSSPEMEEHLNKLMHDPALKYLPRVGTLKYDKEGRVRMLVNEELPDEERCSPINDYPHKEGQDLSGAYVEWIPPYRDSSGQVPGMLYRVWVDPFGHDKDKDQVTVKNSLCSIYVYERTNNFTPHQGDILVAEWVFRTDTLDEANERVLRVCQYWNAICQFESDRGDLKNYFSKQRALHLLADEPDVLFQKEQTNRKNPPKGIKMGAGSDRKGKAAVYLKDMLYTIKRRDDNGKPVYFFEYIYSVGLIKELLKWNLKGNFDRVSALLVGMFDKQEVLNVEIEEAMNSTTDDFFSRPLF
jgi:hypothetical protein